MNLKLPTVAPLAQTPFWGKRPFPTPFLLALFFLLCGQTRDGRSVVLGHPERPAVQDHQMIFTTGSPMTFVSANTRRVRVIATGEEFDQTFYLITRPEDGRSGWVAGWCVNP